MKNTSRRIHWNRQRIGYGGHCPPVGKPRYFFKLYALDTVLPDLKHPAKAALEKTMQGHVRPFRADRVVPALMNRRHDPEAQPCWLTMNEGLK